MTLVSSTIKDDPSSYVLRTMDAAAQDGALVAQSKLGTANESACSLASDSSEGINLTGKQGILPHNQSLFNRSSPTHGHAFA